ncbi:flagellar hook capping FlgD N-terminal domain-containing protein [Lachnobacterium bovis]|jgi:flagellar basal-body rod modification protein FlgD|uniref:Basal-body rod modification protein FlgD n=1 Tax=Lachnobacterium bovis DSM 14045 TaxID=1122142 RepID=A0A1H3EX67_9FIRM|nr:flagellar hook capping FlgD N-terminal domain-containing protein [Lachnobacterium bovis]MBQ1802632.1 flagellar hook capping protein [Lachnobacterium sp.]SDX83366.1 flagellar basal-body rod modification protein FlgD [Lachnobacterium bovis DSM 14045]
MPTAEIRNGVVVNSNNQPESKITSSKSKEVTQNKLGYDAFLKLLCAEMQYQDPLEPTSNTEYVAQLATFSQLEAMLSMQNTTTTNMANSLVGKIVTVEDEEEGKLVEGVVDYVKYIDDKAYVSVDDKLYEIDKVKQVVDSDYYEAKCLAEALTKQIEDLPVKENLTPAYKDAVNQTYKIYDSMSAYAKTFVDKSLIEKLQELKEIVDKFKVTTEETDDKTQETEETDDKEEVSDVEETTDQSETGTDGNS